MPTRTAATVAALGLASAALSLGFAPGALADTTGATGTTGTSTQSTLTVQGNGKVFVTPDVASLSIDVTQTESTSRAALSDANQRADAIVAAIRALGVPATGVQTNSVNVSPETISVGPKGHKHKVKRFTADEEVDVTTTTALVGQAIDAATAHGADGISGPNFSFSNPSAGVVQANAAALTDARQQADAAAAAIGYVVTGVQSVNLDPGADVGVASGAGSQAAAAPVLRKTTTPTTVHPGTQEVDASVVVVYTMAPKPTT